MASRRGNHRGCSSGTTGRPCRLPTIFAPLPLSPFGKATRAALPVGRGPGVHGTASRVPRRRRRIDCTATGGGPAIIDGYTISPAAVDGGAPASGVNGHAIGAAAGVAGGSSSLASAAAARVMPASGIPLVLTRCVVARSTVAAGREHSRLAGRSIDNRDGHGVDEGADGGQAMVAGGD